MRESRRWAIATAVAALLRFLTSGTQSYWYDEAITVELVQRPFHAMLGALPTSESTPPLYYVLAWIWSRMFGTGETGLRSLSAVLGDPHRAGNIRRRAGPGVPAFGALRGGPRGRQPFSRLVLAGSASLCLARPTRRSLAGSAAPGHEARRGPCPRSLGARRGPSAHDALLRTVPRRRGGPLAAASRVGEACSGNGGGRCCRRRRGASPPCCLPGAVLPTHCLDLELRRGRKPSSNTSSINSSSACTRRRTSDR